MKRRELFEDYCLPSVARQTASDFAWLFFVHRPIMSEADLEWFRSVDGRLTLVDVDDPASSGVPEARAAVRRALTAEDDWVLTTRVDSDDILHPDHLRRVRLASTASANVVEFTQGYYYDVRRDELRHVREPENAFVTLIERAENPTTVWTWPHNEIARENTIEYVDEPGWIALIHDHNTTTYLWGDRVSGRRKRAILNEFEVMRPSYVRSRVGRAQHLGRRVRASRRVRRALGVFRV
jgi:hypothetical protein